MPPISENNPQDQLESYKVPTIGIIYPPPELRNIVDKTAGFVARNGPDFEARIRQNEINNAKFNFLNPSDPYHAYYEHKVKELKEGKAPEDTPPPAPVAPPPAPRPVVLQRSEIAKLVEPKVVPKEPPKEYEFVIDPPSISAMELDIVKLTAQFVARNGKNFQTNLINREQRNFQFDFLRPQHSLFPYFRKLVEQYTKILIPDNGLNEELEERSNNPEKVLQDVRYRVEWVKLQESERRKREEDEERERVQYAQIDWHDFNIVETVDYIPNEPGNFPPPTTPQEVGTRALLQQRLENEEIDVEMEVDSDEDEESAAKKQQAAPPAGSSSPPAPEPPKAIQEFVPPPPMPPIHDKVVVKNFNPQQKRPATTTAGQKFLISPITGERVPADKMEEHMRIGLLDPRWVEQRDKQMQEKMAQEEVFAQGSSIESSLKHFAERRTDIFGQEETGIGMRVGEEEEERQPEKPIWDGHSASAEAVARQARANITVEQQIQQIHKMKGLVADDDKEKIGPAKPTAGSSSRGQAPPPPASSAPPRPTQQHQQMHKPSPHHRPPPPSPRQAPPHRPPPPPQQILSTPAPPPPPPQMMMPRPPPPMLAGVPPPLMMAPAPPMMMPVLPHQAPPPPFVSVLPPVSAVIPPPPPPGSMMDTMEAPPGDEPMTKKAKTEDQLIPEEEFLRSQPSDVVAVRIAVPNMADKTEWRLNGQMATISVPLRETFGALKSRIQELTGMPPGKQKLVYDGIFVKDNNSMAFYNVVTNGVVQLQLKERGGRKK